MRIAVFCGSNTGSDIQYKSDTEKLVQSMVYRNMSLVYGGGHVGLMGVLADKAISMQMHTIGVIPQTLAEKELAHTGLDRLIIVKDMHERKEMMAQHADAFIALPGGVGTLEELFEAWTWAQLGLHQKPCGLLNINGYFDPLWDFLQSMVDQNFLKQIHLDMLCKAADPQELLEQLCAYVPPTPKWQTQTACLA